MVLNDKIKDLYSLCHHPTRSFQSFIVVILGDVVENMPWVEHVLEEAKVLQYCLKT